MFEKIPSSIGQALIHQRAGMDSVVYNQLYRRRRTGRLDLRSTAFVFNGRLPVRFTADGAGVSPPLLWSDVPANTGSIALIVEDADSPTPHPLVHAIVVDLGAEVESIEEGALDSPQHRGEGLAMGPNSFLQQAWLPPDPPCGHGEHRYVFQIFALQDGTRAPDAPGRHAFIDLVLERAIAVGCLLGTYERVPREPIAEGTESTLALRSDAGIA